MTEKAPAKDYLLECLRVDLEQTPSDLLELRRTRRAGQSKQPREVPPPRDLTEDQLRDLGEHFFDLEPDDLHARLRKIDASHYPDLRRYQKRLLRLSAARPTLAAALERREISPSFIQSLQQILVLPQKEAVEKKRRLFASLAGPGRREKLESSALCVRQHFPELVALDPDFFDQLSKAKKSLKDSRRPATLGWGIGFFILIQVAFRLMRILLRD